MTPETTPAPVPAETPAPATPAKPQGETLQGLVGDWRKALARSTDGAERFTREKPLLALLIAFVAGILFDELLRSLFGRRR